MLDVIEFSAPSWHEKKRRDIENTAAAIECAVQLSDSGQLDPAAIGLPADIDPEIWNHRLSLVYASSAYTKDWMRADISIFGLAALFSTPVVLKGATKDIWSFVLSAMLPGRTSRTKADVSKVYGIGLDDDGVIGRRGCIESAKASGLLVLQYSTASDGKRGEIVSEEGYAAWAKKKGAPGVPTDGTMADFLNELCKHGPAYRNVNVKLTDEKSGYEVAYDPQDRTRTLVLFEKPLEDELLQKLLALQDSEGNSGFKLLCLEIEILALGRHGCDETSMEPVRLHYGPAWFAKEDNPKPFFAIHGRKLLDPIPIAQKIVSELEKTASTPGTKRAYEGKRFDGEIPRNLRKSLRGVMLGSLIEEQFSGLVRTPANGDAPTNLKRCPFCDEHSSKRGQADNTLYAYNPNPGKGWRFPTVKCRHGSCDHRTTDEFVAKMIELGDLTREAVFENPNYREYYHSKPTKDVIRAAIAKLDENSNSDDWEPTVELIARFGDESFDAEALELIKERTGKQVKTALRNKIKELRKKSAQDDSARALDRALSSDDRVLFDNWDTKGEAFADTCQSVINAVVQANAAAPRLFAMGQGPSRLINHSITGQLSPEPLDYASARHEIARVTRFGRTKKTRDGEEYFQDVPVPEAIAQHVINTPNIPLPILVSVTDTPYFDRDGSLVTEPGYKAASKIFYQPPPNFDIGCVPKEPTDADIEAAKSILAEAICDIPFNDCPELDPEGKGQASKANWFAKLIQPFVREMIGEEPCPLHLTQKPKTRTGASLLTKVYSEIAFGCAPAFETAKPDEAEQQKTIITHLKAGSRNIIIDNWPQGKVFDDPTVASLVTAYIYRGRLLCTNEFVCEPWTGVFDVNGNNVQLSDELRERTLLVRLDAAMENPNDRSGFTHPDLIPWVKANRAQLVRAVLILAQAWIARGKKPWSGKPLGGFEACCSIMGGILECAGIEGFLANRELLRASVGSADDAFKTFVQVWWNQFKDTRMKVGTLDHDASSDDYLPEDYVLKEGFEDHRQKAETLVDLLLVHSEEINLGFNGWKKAGWQKGMGQELIDHKDQVFDLEDGICVRLNYRKPTGSGMRGWFWSG